MAWLKDVDWNGIRERKFASPFVPQAGDNFSQKVVDEGFKDENEDMIISQKRPKDKIQKIPQLLKKTENQSVERKTNLEKKIDKNQLKKLQEGNLSTDPKRLTNTNRKKKLKK